ncbi:MAG: type II toxin-antitoxin system RelE/ParE family toxin [Oscillospiraceae bacterium]|nr:type II toxin-antitoxin system RelE/ParE family toxin [Oscillospiraceae bacterium]
MIRKAGFTYEIRYAKAAEKFFTTHEEIREQFEESIRELLSGEHPEQVDVKRIRGKRNDYYRIRLGEYRVVYAVINGTIVVIHTLLAGPRGDVYKKMGGLK